MLARSARASIGRSSPRDREHRRGSRVVWASPTAASGYGRLRLVPLQTLQGWQRLTDLIQPQVNVGFSSSRRASFRMPWFGLDAMPRPEPHLLQKSSLMTSSPSKVLHVRRRPAVRKRLALESFQVLRPTGCACSPAKPGFFQWEISSGLRSYGWAAFTISRRASSPLTPVRKSSMRARASISASSLSLESCLASSSVCSIRWSMSRSFGKSGRE